MKLFLASFLVAAAVAVATWRLTGAPAEPSREDTRFRQPRFLAVDSSGNGNHGVNQGEPVLGVPGHRGTAYSFEEEGSWVQVPSNPDLVPGDRDFLVTAWVSLTVAPALGETFDVVRKGLSWQPDGEFKLEVVTGGRVKCSLKDHSRTFVAVTGPEKSIADGRWHRIGCARTGRVVSVIVDRTLTSELGDLGWIGNNMPLSIGSKYGLEDSPPGGTRVDDVAIRAGARSRPRRAPVDPRQAVRALQRTPPVALWRLDEIPPG